MAIVVDLIPDLIPRDETPVNIHLHNLGLQLLMVLVVVRWW